MKLSNFCGEPSRLQKIAQLSEMLVCVLQCPLRPSRDIHRIATIRAQECSNLRCDRCPAAALLAPAVLELSTGRSFTMLEEGRYYLDLLILLKA